MPRRCLLLLSVLSAGALTAGVAAAPPALGTKAPYPPVRGPFHALVEDGRPVAHIVLPEEPTDVEQFAAEELASYVEQISGADLPIRRTMGPDGYPVLLGRAALRRGRDAEDLAPLGPDGFIVRSSSSGLVIAGGSDLGTLFGVYYLLEKYLGVRWFMPGDLGTVIPRSPNIAIGAINDIEKPDFRIRWIESGEWALHNRMNVGVDVGGQPVGIKWKWAYHSLLAIVPPDKYFDEHPEYFALISGVRRRPGARRGHQLCTSNPEVVRVVAENVCKILDEDPDIDVISVCPEDGGGFCECEKCRALDEERPPEQAWHARYSSRLAVFNNAVARLVARRHPDKLIKVGAYAMYMRAPLDADYRPEPNLAIQACHTYACNNHRIASPTCRRNRVYFGDDLERWADIAQHVFIYEYYNKGAWGGLPYPQAHVIKWDIPYFRSLGVEAFFTQAAGRRFPVVGLNHYLAAKLVWDSDLDVELLLEDFYEKFYQEAARPMGRYWSRLESAFEGNPECLSPYGYKWVSLAAPGFFTPEVLADCEAAVSEAERLAESDAVRKRVHVCRVTLDFTKMAMEYLKAVQAPFEGIDRDDADAVKAAHEASIRIGDPLSARLRAYCSDNEIPPFERLIAAHKTLRFVMPRPDDEALLH